MNTSSTREIAPSALRERVPYITSWSEETRLVFAGDHGAAVWEIRRVRVVRRVGGGELSPVRGQRAVPRLWRCGVVGERGVDLMAVAARSAVSEKGKSW